jgi:hypothetical protein
MNYHDHGTATPHTYILPSHSPTRIALVLHAWMDAGFAIAHTLIAGPGFGCQCWFSGIGLSLASDQAPLERFCGVPTHFVESTMLLPGSNSGFDRRVDDAGARDV